MPKGTFWEHFETILAPFWGHLGIILGQFSENGGDKLEDVGRLFDIVAYHFGTIIRTMTTRTNNRT